MRIWTSLTLAGLVAGALTGAVMAQTAGLNGVWARGDGNARVRIGPCGDKICATNIWIKDTSGGEEVGDRLVMSLTGEGGTRSGEAFDQKRDRTYKMELSVNGRNMTTKGCILGGLLCRNVAWTKVD